MEHQPSLLNPLRCNEITSKTLRKLSAHRLDLSLQKLQNSNTQLHPNSTGIVRARHIYNKHKLSLFFIVQTALCSPT